MPLFLLCKRKPPLSLINNDSIDQKQVKVMSNMKTNEIRLKRNDNIVLSMLVDGFIIEKCIEVADESKRSTFLRKMCRSKVVPANLVYVPAPLPLQCMVVQQIHTQYVGETHVFQIRNSSVATRRCN